MNYVGILLIVAGLYCMLMAVTNAGFFWNGKGRMFAALLGPAGARIAYGVIGIALVVFGALRMIGTV